MYLVIGIILLCLAGLIGAGKNQPEWKKEGYSSYGDYTKAKLCGRRKTTYQEESYYFQKAQQEWDDPKWTDPEILEFVRVHEHIRYLIDIANKMAYDDGLAPFNDMTKYDPNNIHKGYWEGSEFAFKKWKEEGILPPY